MLFRQASRVLPPSGFDRSLSRRTVLGVGMGLLAVPLLQACAGAATPTAVPTKPAPQQTTPPAPAAKPTTAAPTSAPAAATQPAAATKPAAATAPAAATKPAAATTPASAATKPAAAPGTAQPAASAPLSKIGGTVGVLATWGGDEQDSFLAMVKPFEEQTGTKVQYEGTRDLNAVLTTRTQGGNPPDTAALPGPGQMAQLARSGKMIDLSSSFDMTRLKAQYAEDWLKLGQVDGKQVGIVIKAALKGLIWYNPPAFKKAGFEIPSSWDQLMQLGQKMASTNTPPWSIGLESGAASGWPGTDWLEDIVLRQAGPDVYDKWHQGKQKWSSPEIRKAWETWGQIVGDPRMVVGGRATMLSTNFGDAVNPLFVEPPRAYLHHQASFITTFITKANPNVKPVEGFNFFPFPDIDQKYAGALESAGDLFGAFKDTPQARALVGYLATPEAQAIWAKRGGMLSANKQVPIETYPDQLARDSAKTLVGAKVVRFDASDLMPEAMNNAFLKAILDFVNDPKNLDSILTNLDKVQADSYKA